MGFTSVFFLTAALVGTSAANRYEGRLVTTIDIVLEGGSPPAAAKSLIEVNAGEPYRSEAVRRSIKQLFALGEFSDIKVEAEPRGNDLALTFHLYPALIVSEVRIESTSDQLGNWEQHQKELQEISVVQPGSLFDAPSTEAAARRMEEELRREGFYEAQVVPEAAFQGSAVRILYHVEPGPQATITDLFVHGTGVHIERDIRQKIPLKAGELYSRKELDVAVDRLRKQWKDNGFFLAQVDVRETLVPPDAVKVDLEIDLGPRVIVEVEGAELSERSMRQMVPIIREQSISSDIIEESRGNIEEYYQERGYRDVAVTLKRTTAEQDRYLVLTFQIDLGQKYRIGEVEIRGLTTIPAESLMTVMTMKAKRFRETAFQPLVWEEDLKQIRNTLREEGFHRVSVEGQIVDRDDVPGEIDLIVQIEEGPRAFIESIELEGTVGVTSAEIIEASSLVIGAPFYAPRVMEARELILNLYRNRGYREADVEARSSIDETGEAVAVAFEIGEGEQTFVGRVITTGLVVTKDKALANAIKIESNAPLSSAALLETRQRLIGTGLFRDVDIEVMELDPSSRTSDILIRLEEGPRTSFGYGFGYNERELARAEAEITRRNLFGLNRTINVFGRVSIRGGRFITTYRQPEFFKWQLPIFLTAFYEEEDRTSFDYRRVGAGFQISKAASATRNYFFRYNYNLTEVDSLEIPPSELPKEFRNIRLSSVSVSQVTDTRDDALTPSRGQFRLLDLEYSAKLLGSKSPYLKGLAQQFFYFNLPKTIVGVIGARLGIGQTFRDDRDALMPITERFFAGGANTLRGFGLDQASPKDPFGNPVGGNVLTLLNLELRFPITGKLRGVVFSDNGAVYRRLSNIRYGFLLPKNWRYNAGFGFRYDTPLGPLRVDWGFKIDIRPGEPRSRVHVSLGHAF
jgi:outer membrane protein assembly complex protein YaeT